MICTLTTTTIFIYFVPFQSDASLEVEKMEKANETWTNDLCPIESGENTDDAQVSFSILSDIS